MELQDVHAADARGKAALHEAVEQDDKPLLLQLLQAGADVEVCTKAGNSSLHLAAKAGRTLLIPHLVTAVTLNQQNSQGYTPLQEALLYKQWHAAAMLVAAGAAPYGPGSCPSLSSLATPLDGPSDPGLLLKAMLADPSPTGLVAQAMRWKDVRGRTALHTAANGGNVEGVTNLLKAGADRDAVSNAGATPLWLAAAAGHAQLVPLLVTSGNIDFATNGCTSPLYAAAGEGQEWVPAADRRRSGARSPLAAAAINGHTTVVALLLEELVREWQQQEGWQQGQGQAKLVAAVAAAVASVAAESEDVTCCCQLLEAVMDVLGAHQEVVRKVMQEAEQQLQQGVSGQASPPRWYDRQGRDSNRLTVALLLGWLGAEARRLAPARLQRLVPGVEGGKKQEQEQQQQCQPQQPQRQRQQQESPPTRKQVQKQLTRLAEQAVLAAVAGHWQRVDDHLQEYAGLYLRHLCPGGEACISTVGPFGGPGLIRKGGSCQRASCSHLVPIWWPNIHTPADAQQPGCPATPQAIPWLVWNLDKGLSWAKNNPSSLRGRGRSILDVYFHLLCGWATAQRTPSDGLVGAVVAAVTAAQQQEQP
jgi:hypothetical protein